MPSFDCRNTAVPGKWMSGESVARMMQSMSLGAQPGVLDGALRRREGEIAARPRAVVRHVAALLDARALPDPLVAGLDLRLAQPDVSIVEVADLLVGDDAIGDEGAEAEDLGTTHNPRRTRLYAPKRAPFRWHAAYYAEARAAAAAAVPAPAGLPLAFVASTDAQRGVPTFLWAMAGAPGNTVPAGRSLAPADAARVYLAAHAARYGLSSAALSTAAVVRVLDLGHGGIVVVLRQRVAGADVFHDDVKVLMDRSLRLVAIGGNLHAGAVPTPKTRGFVRSEPQAIARAFRDLYGAALGPADVVDLGRTAGDYRDLPARPRQDGEGGGDPVDRARAREARLLPAPRPHRAGALPRDPRVDPARRPLGRLRVRDRGGRRAPPLPREPDAPRHLRLPRLGRHDRRPPARGRAARRLHAAPDRRAGRELPALRPARPRLHRRVRQDGQSMAADRRDDRARGTTSTPTPTTTTPRASRPATPAR